MCDKKKTKEADFFYVTITKAPEMTKKTKVKKRSRK